MCFKGILVVALVVAGGTHFKPFVLSIRHWDGVSDILTTTG
jgi:hypothetical protein